MSKYGLTSHSTHNRTFWKWVSTGKWLTGSGNKTQQYSKKTKYTKPETYFNINKLDLVKKYAKTTKTCSKKRIIKLEPTVICVCILLCKTAHNTEQNVRIIFPHVVYWRDGFQVHVANFVKKVSSLTFVSFLVKMSRVTSISGADNHRNL